MNDDYNFNDDSLSQPLTQPSNREAEEALIGAVLINPMFIWRLLSFFLPMIFP